MIIYDNKPKMYESNRDGSYKYRWDIKSVSTPGPDGSTESKWQCKEVIIWATVTRDKITAAVIAALWDNDREKKLINDYNAAVAGVFDDHDMTRVAIDNYMGFLTERQRIKEQIATDCVELGIL